MDIQAEQSSQNQLDRKMQLHKPTVIQPLRGPKKRHLDQLIDRVISIKDARTFYYTQSSVLQDHHYILLEQKILSLKTLSQDQKDTSHKSRFQQQNNQQVTPAEILQGKMHSKIVNRIQFLDTEDFYALVRMLAKQEHPQNTDFVIEVVTKIKDRLTSDEQLQQDIRSFETSQLLFFFLYTVKIYNNLMLERNNEQITQSLSATGDILVKLFVKHLPLDLTNEYLLKGFTMLSQMHLSSKSELKQIINKLKGVVNDLSPDQNLELLQSLTRLQTTGIMKQDPNLVNQIVYKIMGLIDKLMYQDIAKLLELLLALDYQSESVLGGEITHELQRRYLEYKEKGSAKCKIGVQEALRIYRLLIQSGYMQFTKNVNLVKQLQNIIFKNLDKMPTNQLHECSFLLRVVEAQLSQSNIKQSFVNLFNNVKDLIHKKLPKFNASRLIFMCLQDQLMSSSHQFALTSGFESTDRDQHSLIDTVQFMQYSVESMLHNIQDLETVNELNILVNLFSTKQDNGFNSAEKFANVALKAFKYKLNKIRKDKLISHKPNPEDVQQLIKILYVICMNEVRYDLKQQPGHIKNKVLWEEISANMDQLEKIGALRNLKLDKFPQIQDIMRFQNIVLEDKFQLIPQEFLKNINYTRNEGAKEQEQTEARFIKGVKEIKERGIEVEQDLTYKINDTDIVVDMLLPEQKIAINLVENSQPQEPFYLTTKSMLDKHNIFLLGVQKYTNTDKIKEIYDKAASCPLDKYSLKYFEDLELIIADKSKIKSETYFNSLIKPIN